MPFAPGQCYFSIPQLVGQGTHKTPEQSQSRCLSRQIAKNTNVQPTHNPTDRSILDL